MDTPAIESGNIAIVMAEQALEQGDLDAAEVLYLQASNIYSFHFPGFLGFTFKLLNYGNSC